MATLAATTVLLISVRAVDFTPPARGFISAAPAADWQHGLLTGNGTVGAIVPGQPFDETLYLSHTGLFLPNPNNPRYIEMAPDLEKLRQLCFAGDYRAVRDYLPTARTKTDYRDERDPFISAFTLRVRQPEARVTRYQRAVDWLTAEASVGVEHAGGAFQRSVFASRADDVIVLRLVGRGKQSAEFAFAALPARTDKEKRVVADGIKASTGGVRDGLLYFRSEFAQANPFNPHAGYEGFGKVIARGGTCTEGDGAIRIADADEILVLVKIVPLDRAAGVTTNFPAARAALDALPADYVKLLAPHAARHGDLMRRVEFSLDAPAADLAKPTEQLIADSARLDAPLAKIERAFDAGRYNIICSTGHHPPNLMGLWSGTWLAPWAGSFTVDGNLPCAVSFNLMGNTPELMEPFFRYFDTRWDGFRRNAKAIYGTRGFHVPAQLTLSPLETDFSPRWPLIYWHTGAAWMLQSYYDYYLYTGDRRFLADRAYPLLKEAAAFYEDFLTVTDDKGQVVFVPSYSPENAPINEDKFPAVTINATMDVAAARQLLGNAMAAAKLLGLDSGLQTKWAAIVAKLPPYEVGSDGSFREWLWPGLAENNEHRHASHLYALYDGMPPEIVNDPVLVKAVEHTIRGRMDFREKTSGDMAFGIVQTGLAAAHVRNAGLTQQAINLLARDYWASGLASFHNTGNLFNMDISGGLPTLCVSALVYADPGLIRFFPARPPQWERGALRGVRLRGGIVVRELRWHGARAHALLVSDADQTVTIESPGAVGRTLHLRAGMPTPLDL